MVRLKLIEIILVKMQKEQGCLAKLGVVLGVC
jgi:hypothetical protein